MAHGHHYETALYKVTPADSIATSAATSTPSPIAIPKSDRAKRIQGMHTVADNKTCDDKIENCR